MDEITSLTAEPPPPPTPIPQSPTPVVVPNDTPKPSKHNGPFIALGLVALIALVAGGYFLTNSLKPSTPITTTVRPTTAPKPLFLSLNSPQGNVSIASGEVLVAGLTLPNTTVVAFSDTDDSTVTSDASGKFETSVLVDPNGGLVQVIAYSETGDEQSLTVDLNPNTQVLGREDAPGQVKKETNTSNENSNSGSSTNSNSRRENENESRGRSSTPKPLPTNRPIKDSTEVTSFEVQNFLATQYPNQRQTKQGPSKLRLTLNQQSLASGSAGSIRKMDARTATPGATLKRHSVMGVITSISDGVISIRHQTQVNRTYTIFYNANTVITMKSSSEASTSGTLTGASGLAVGMRITAVGTPSAEGILATRIHVIPGKAVGVFNRFPVASPSGAFASPSATPVASPSATSIPTPTPTTGV